MGMPERRGRSPQERISHAFDSLGFNYLRIYFSQYQARADILQLPKKKRNRGIGIEVHRPTPSTTLLQISPAFTGKISSENLSGFQENPAGKTKVVEGVGSLFCKAKSSEHHSGSIRLIVPGPLFND